MQLAVHAYPRFWRGLVGALVALSRASPIVLLVLLLFFETRLTNPLRLIRVFAAACLAPALAALLIRRLFEARLEIAGGMLILETSGRRVELPLASVARAEPWRLPLPGPGVRLRLRSGADFPYAIEVTRPAPLVEAIATGDARTSALPADSSEEPGSRRHAFLRPLLDYVVLALVPAVPLFRLHQWITYGGTFGEYYIYGLEAYVLAFLVYWANASIWLVLYDAVLRAVVVMLATTVAILSPSHPARLRVALETIRGLFFYGGIAAFMVRLYLMSRT
jgi:apolipoprotein N-acyltransferase